MNGVVRLLLVGLTLLASQSALAQYTTGDAAYSACQTDRATNLTAGRNIESGLDCAYSTTGTNGARYWLKIGNTQMTVFERQYSFPRFACSTGKEWNASFNKCVTSAAQCAALAAKNDDPNSDMFIPLDQSRAYVGDGTYCAGGCAMAVDATQRESATTNGVGFTIGRRHFTGASCGTPAPGTGDTAPTANPPPPTQPACAPASDGQTFCVTQEGKHCYPTADPGRMICWKPGETGSKTDGKTAQQRQAGTTKPPAPTPPPGETFTDQNKPATTTDTKTSGGSSTTSTTTTNNYYTNYGTNAGTTNQGQTQGSTSGGESASGSGNGASGGTDCATPYSTTGDPIAGAALKEAWKANCAWDAAKTTLEGKDHSDGTEGMGTEQDAKDSIWKQGDASDLENRYGAGVTETAFGGSSSGGSCPTLPVVDLGELGRIDPNSDELCDAVAIARWVIIFLAYGMALRMVL